MQDQVESIAFTIINGLIWSAMRLQTIYSMYSLIGEGKSPCLINQLCECQELALEGWKIHILFSVLAAIYDVQNVYIMQF